MAHYKEVEVAAIRVEKELGPIDVWVISTEITLPAELPPQRERLFCSNSSPTIRVEDDPVAEARMAAGSRWRIRRTDQCRVPRPD